MALTSVEWNCFFNEQQSWTLKCLHTISHIGVILLYQLMQYKCGIDVCYYIGRQLHSLESLQLTLGTAEKYLVTVIQQYRRCTLTRKPLHSRLPCITMYNKLEMLVQSNHHHGEERVGHSPTIERVFAMFKSDLMSHQGKKLDRSSKCRHMVFALVNILGSTDNKSVTSSNPE